MKPMKVKTTYPKDPIFGFNDWITWIRLSYKWTKRNNKYKNQVG